MSSHDAQPTARDEQAQRLGGEELEGFLHQMLYAVGSIPALVAFANLAWALAAP